MADGIYQHFRPEERDFIDQMRQHLYRVEAYQAPYLTDFLNPRQATIVENLLGQQDEVIAFSSRQWTGMELQRLLLAPSYFQPVWEDFEVSLVAVHFPSRFVSLSHREIMGTLLHQLGLDRSRFGDIRVTADQAQFFVDSKLLAYVLQEIDCMGKASVTLEAVRLEEALPQQDDYVPAQLLVSSLRLDKIVAAGFKLSRQVAAQLIGHKKVSLNYAVTEKTSLTVESDDIISVRGYGRLRVGPVEGQSRSGKLRLQVGIIKNK